MLLTLKKYILSLSPEDQQYFAQFLQLQYGSSKMRPPISSAQYAEFHEKMGEWPNTYKLTNEFAAKMILDCMAHNFEKFTFEQVRYVQPKSNSNVVHCPSVVLHQSQQKNKVTDFSAGLVHLRRRISARMRP